MSQGSSYVPVFLTEVSLVWETAATAEATYATAMLTTETFAWDAIVARIVPPFVLRM
jgi:hypothetical protein